VLARAEAIGRSVAAADPIAVGVRRTRPALYRGLWEAAAAHQVEPKFPAPHWGRSACRTSITAGECRAFPPLPHPRAAAGIAGLGPATAAFVRDRPRADGRRSAENCPTCLTSADTSLSCPHDRTSESVRRAEHPHGVVLLRARAAVSGCPDVGHERCRAARGSVAQRSTSSNTNTATPWRSRASLRPASGRSQLSGRAVEEEQRPPSANGRSAVAAADNTGVPNVERPTKGVRVW
jgi:hypothetical protein